MPPVTNVWQRTLVACGVLTLLVAALFWPTLDTMVGIWANVETYSHGFVILPISLWLAYRQRDRLLAQPPRPAPWVLLPCLLAGIGWALAHLLGIQVAEQLALVGLWVAGLWALVGHRAARLLAFPLLFLFLMVPMGDSLVPPMMDFTADFTVWMLELSGIPVYREGLFFVIPSGNWSVVEACSGVRYLIASVTLGLLYAYLTYRSLWRRALFVVLSALVPILANGLRAYMIVMIGHLSDMKLAVGVDHLIYGWIFFGLVMLLLFWLGGLWAEDQPAEDVAPAQAYGPQGSAVRLVGVLLGTLLVATMVRAGAAELDGIGGPGNAVALPAQAGGWQQGEPQLTWPVDLPGADRLVQAGFSKDGGEVTVVFGVFDRQRQGAEVVSSRNTVLARDAGNWRVTSRTRLPLSLGGDSLTVPLHHLVQKRGYLFGEATQQVAVANWYRLGDHDTASEYLGKWYQALALLGDGRADGAFVMLGTRDDGEAAGRLQAFATEALPALLDSLDAARR